MQTGATATARLPHLLHRPKEFEGVKVTPPCNTGTNACNWFLPLMPSTSTFAWRSLKNKSFSSFVFDSYHTIAEQQCLLILVLVHIRVRARDHIKGSSSG